MTYNWCYFPLASNGQVEGIQNPLPEFLTETGDPWSANSGWFTGDGSSTSLISPWNSAPDLFDGVALPKDRSYLIGFQVELELPPDSGQVLFFCGYNKAGITDGLQCFYAKSGQIIFECRNRNFAHVSVGTLSSDLANRTINFFCHVDHRPAGVGADSAFVHTYEDGSDIKSTSFYGADLSVIGDIYPQEIDSATAIIVGASQGNGNPLQGTHFSGKIRRLHLMQFGAQSDDQPSNIAELMNALSNANMIPTPEIQQLMGFSTSSAVSRAFVRYA